MYQICFKAFATLHFLNVSKKEQRNLYKVDRISSKIIVSQQVSVGMKAVLIILKSKMFPNQSSQVPTKRKKKRKWKKRKISFFFISAMVVQHLPLAVVVPIFILSDSSSWTEPEPVRPRGRLPASTKLNLIRWEQYAKMVNSLPSTYHDTSHSAGPLLQQ